MGTVGIRGFGRIGRLATRVALKNGLFVPKAICDVYEPDAMAALFEVDTNYGRWADPVSAESDALLIGENRIAFCKAPKAVPDWKALGVDVVVDCTSLATRRDGAMAHIERGCKKVLVSAPSKTLNDCDAVLLPGINLDAYQADRHHIISMASCTTNALAPVVKVIRETWGMRAGFFSTVHAYTGTQALTDQPRADRRDSWAATENIIPSASGAAKALKFIWPDLNLTGKAYRVPVRTGSIAELTVLLDRTTDLSAVRDAFREAAQKAPLKGIMGVLEGEYASCRVMGEPHSSLVDLPLMDLADSQLLTVAAWYDNEWGYATRLAETARRLAGS